MHAAEKTSIIGVKFCGGCRAAYPRKTAAAHVERRVRAHAPARFVPAERGGAYDALLVMAGCGAVCPDTSGYAYGRAVCVTGEGGCERAADELAALALGSEGCAPVES